MHTQIGYTYLKKNLLINITECFIPHYAVSDHYPVCLTRKVNHKLPKAEHITTTYRCFKKINENAFLSDLAEDLQNLELHCVTVDDDLAVWHSIMINQLDMHAPVTLR